MGIENVQSFARADYLDRVGRDYMEDKPSDAKPHELDSQENQAKHRRLLEWWEQERERQSENRREQALDCDYYDGLQWDWESAQELLARGQAPLTYNLVKPTLDWIIGTERRMRVDFRVLPRAEDDVETAGIKSKVLKYLSDVNKTPFQRSRAFEDTVKAGVGWLEDGVRADPSDEPIFSRYESWRYLWWDSLGVELDMSDWRYLFRVKSLDVDVACAFFPERKALIKRSAYGQQIERGEEDEEYFYLGEPYIRSRDFLPSSGAVRRIWYTDANLLSARRERVRMYEGWYREPVRLKVMRGDVMNGVPFDPRNKLMRDALRRGAVTLVDNVFMQVRLGIFTEQGLVYEGRSPYQHNRFPFTPMWCYRRTRDNMPYGAIRNLRDPQDDFNKRSSKVLFLLSANRLIADRDAFDNPDEAREEAASPDAFLLKKKGSEVKFESGQTLAESHFKLAQMNMMLIQKAAGVTDDNLGRQTNAESGEAIKARQSEGAMQTLGIFDNKRLATQLQGEVQLSLAEQFITQPKVIRLTGHRNQLEWTKVNQPQYDPQTGQVRWLNDITATKADFVVDEQDFHASLREALFEEMMKLVSKLPPELGLRFLDLVVDLVDIPGKNVLVQRIRKITGEVDPDEEARPSPEKQAEMKAKAAADAAAQAMQQRAMVAEVMEKEGKAKKLAAEAERIGAETEKIRAEIGMDGPSPEQQKALQGLQEQIQDLTAELQKAEQALADRKAEIEADVEKARIEKESAKEVAEIEARAAANIKGFDEVVSMVEDLRGTVEDLTKQLEEARARSEGAEEERKKHDAERKDAEKKKAVEDKAKSAAEPKGPLVVFEEGAIQVVNAAGDPVAKTITAKTPSGQKIEMRIEPDAPKKPSKE